MAKDIVFVLHGVGQYEPGWVDKQPSAVPVLRELANQYPYFDGKTLDSYVDFVPVLYDDVFQRIMAHWSDLGEGLAASVPVLPSFLESTMKFLRGSKDNDWARTHAADAALYWGFRLFQQRVVLRVLAQMTAKIADTIGGPEGRPQYHVLAHSLGTAVAHDALHHLGTEAWLGQLQGATFDDDDNHAAAADRDQYLGSISAIRRHDTNPLSPKRFKFETITMLSNVTGLIHPSTSPYHSIVRPGSTSDVGAYTQNYFNVNHKFDPISIAGSFKMPKAWRLLGGFDISIDHVFGDPLDIHDAAHYVRNPRVHLPLLAFYVNGYSPSRDLAQIGAFERTCREILTEAAKGKLEQFSKGEKGDVGKLLKLLVEFRKLEEEAR
jgi:hypothetical protein